MPAARSRLRLFAGPNGSGNEAVIHTDRAYIFDNSGEMKTWITELNEGREVTMQANWMPAWFKSALWDKFEEVP